MAARVVSAVLGVWLMFAPAVLHYGGAAASNDRIVGPTVAALSVIACWEIARGLRFAVLPLAAWCAAAPFLLEYTSAAATANDALIGVALVGLTFVGRAISQPYGGGWRVLFRAGE